MRTRTFHLTFNKEEDNCWYIDFPNFPFGHGNLMMVAGADKLCQYVAEKEGHPNCAVVDVTTGKHRLDGRTPDIVMKRVRVGHGADYKNYLPDGTAPKISTLADDMAVSDAWICPVTLMVLGRYPKQINLYLKD